MSLINAKLTELLNRHDWTEEEKQWLSAYLENHEATELFEIMQDDFLKEASNEEKELPGNISGELLEKIHLRIKNIPQPVKVIRLPLWKRLTAAAAVVILLATGVYVFKNSSVRTGEETKVATSAKHFKNDVPPGSNKALLTLADGSTIVLDDAKNGDLTQQGNTRVIKLNGKLAYNPATMTAAEIVYNTISTPRGGKYQIELPDGSQVWLNSASSLHFPIAFVGNQRKVEITGEAYLEVAKNKNMPFIVSVNGAEVQVLGTHFNIMAYQDEEMVKTTLLEGSVKFVNGNNTSLLKPRQQSQLLKNGQVTVVSDVDVENVISWKNGMFNFEKADMETVMRQLSRWYDVDVVFKSKKSYDPLHVEIPFNTNLSDALKALELAGTAKFEIEGKKIIVTQ